MKILEKILMAIVVLLVIVLVIGFLAPQQVTLERSITINSNSSAIFDEMSSMKSFNSWSPWATIDPEGTTYQYKGPEMGVGSQMSWTSEHPDVGTGDQEIVEMEKNKKVRTKILFGGFDEPSYANVILNPSDAGTDVTWTFEGDMGSNPMNKIFGLMMDTFLGPSYEEGLANLKRVVEAKPKFSIDPNIIDVDKMHFLGIREAFDMSDEAAIGQRMVMLWGKIGAYMESKNIAPTGAPFSLYHMMNDSVWDASIAMPVAETDATPDKGIDSGQTFEGKALFVKHMGDFMLLGNTHKEIQKYMEYKGLTTNGNGYEVYMTDPANEPDTSKWVTQIYYPVQ